MHPEIQQILVRDHLRSLHAEASANRLAVSARPNPTPPPRSPLAAVIGPLLRAGRTVVRAAAG